MSTTILAKVDGALQAALVPLAARPPEIKRRLRRGTSPTPLGERRPPLHRLRYFSLLLMVMVIALAGCGGIVHSKEIAADAMDQFHERFNAGEFDKIYDTADGPFQAANTRAEFLKYLAAVHRKLGDYKSCDNQGWNSNYVNGDTNVTLRYKTTFSKGTGNEEFVFDIGGSRAVLRNYRIDSNTLVTE